MAAQTKHEFADSVMKRLTFLNCDYIEGMDDKAVADLILTPGQGRFYILQWLFTRYDSRLACMLNPTQDHIMLKNDSTLQRLVAAASSMCLCRPDDTDLIRGDVPLAKQMSFITKLLDLVCTREKSFSQDSSKLPNPSQLSSYMDAVVGKEGFLYMLEDSIDLLPRDIKAEVERDWARSGWDKDLRVPPVPNFDELLMRSQDLSVELEKHNLTLTRLKEEITAQEESCHTEVLGLNQVLCRALRDLSQLCKGFSQCYETSVEQWCHRSLPQLSQLGPVFHRVHTQLSKFTKMLEDLTALRQHTSELDRHVREQPAYVSQSLVEESKQVYGNFESCLIILEEALHRSATEFNSRPPLLTL
ncbi:hypothetical protein RRG08_020813 [Elysia crispata]|uniref:HAUS augmin-like complex subunit 7 n=1 Tax=Elysia crispata TaxID=231223 RepID=A0AAE1D2U9_9GAST|nr:hypothetical protein RRG08_020813 [Elysia crispata]